MNVYVEVFPRYADDGAGNVHLFWYASAVFGIKLMSMWFAAFFIVSINTGAYMAETVRGGILSIDEGSDRRARKAIGMTHVQTMLYVILPQALQKHHAADRQQPDHQHQGQLRAVRDRCGRAASMQAKSPRQAPCTRTLRSFAIAMVDVFRH